jgi:DNA 3'-phosphatase
MNHDLSPRSTASGISVRSNTSFTSNRSTISTRSTISNVSTISVDKFKTNNVHTPHWKDYGTIMIYHNTEFVFKPECIIVDMDECLIKYMPKYKIYDTLNNYEFQIRDNGFIRRLRSENHKKSIILLSNQVNTSKLNIDQIKRKFEFIVDKLNLPMIAIFALKNNCFMKPHTGMWRWLKILYKDYGHMSIESALIVSDEGGIIESKEKKRTGEITEKISVSDVDRAFAWNIEQPFMTLGEFVDHTKPPPFRWNSRIIDPDTRQPYLQILDDAEKRNPSISSVLNNFGKREYYVMIMLGAPCSGKTTLAKTIISKWRKSQFGKSNAIERLGTDNYTAIKRLKTFKAMCDQRISTIIDGDMYTNQTRDPYLKYLKGKNIPVVYILVNPGNAMARVFNHSRVEDSNDDKICLRKIDDFSIYTSRYKAPTITSSLVKLIEWYPKIQKTPSIVKYRY